MIRTRIPKISNYLMAGLVIGFFLFLSYARVLDEFEYNLLDVRYRIRPTRKTLDEIAVIEISDDTIEKLGQWPIERQYHALLLQALNSAGVKAVVFDIFFSERRSGDEELTRRIKTSGNVYLPYVMDIDPLSRDSRMLEARGFIAPLLEELENAAKGTGYVNVEADRDGKIRRISPLIEYDGRYYPNLTFAVALDHLGVDIGDIKVYPGDRIILGEDRFIPLDHNSSVLVDYPGKWGETFRHYSYVNVLQSYMSGVTGQEPLMDLAELEGSVCFVALTAAASPDAHPSPLEKLYPGVGVHCSFYESLIRNRFPVRANRWINLGILLFLWVSSIHVTERTGKRYALAAMLLLMAGFTVTAFLLFWPVGVWIDLFYPLLTMSGIYVLFTFKKYVDEAKKREVIEKELSIAKEIQESFLPAVIPEVGGLEIHTRMLTASQVGGDLYDVIEPAPGKLGVMIGDVSGKGVPAALYMARAVTEFKTMSKEELDVSRVLAGINSRLASGSGVSLFVTLTYMIFDPENKELSYSIGGHLPTVEILPDGSVNLLDSDEGLPLGMIEGDYSVSRKEYVPETMYILYSDGVTEAMDTKREMFGQERLIELAPELAGLTAEQAVETIHKAVSDFAGKAKQHDDITVMVIKT